MKKLLFLIYLFAYSLIPAFAQQNKIDSLLAMLQTANQDSGKVNTLNALAVELKGKNTDSSIMLSNKALEIALSLGGYGGLDGAANSYNNLGMFNQMKGNYSVALNHYLKAIELWEKSGTGANEKKQRLLKNKKAKALGNIGIIYKKQGDYPKALDYYLRALKMKEELENKEEIAVTLGNIGIIYQEQQDYDKALSYYNRALKIAEELQDKNAIARHLGNIGVVHMMRHNYPQALDYYLKALKMAEELGNKTLIAAWQGNIGNTCYEAAQDEKAGLSRNEMLDKAQDYYFRALKTEEELGDKNGIAIWQGNIGGLFISTSQYKEAEVYLQKALVLSNAIGYLDGVREWEQNFSDLYTKTGRYKLALEHYKKYIAVRDSIANDENTKKQTRLEMNYEFEKKQTADSIRNAEQLKQEELKHNQEIQQQKTYTYGGAIGFLLMIVVAGVSFRAYKTKQKANIIIAEQKKLVEEKQKDILDSIHYAKRIQNSLLPTDKYIDKNLKRLTKK